ncbi:MAG: carbon storage regulator [Bradyrhizobium sp.]|uniref:carbon storage regulator n=1 Tax=Bradyrhizobium sp. TaxID=376 RepID=UPI003D14D630
MLVVRRVLEEGVKITVGEVEVFVHVVAIAPGFCRIGVRAPRAVPVERCDALGLSQCKKTTKRKDNQK